MNEMSHEANSIGCIDGMTALIMAIGRYIASTGEGLPALHLI